MAIKNKPSSKPPTQKASTKSLADLFDDTDASEATNTLPAGEHEVRLNSFEVKENPTKGTGAFAEYEAIDGDYEGKKVRQMYKLTDASGNAAPGLAYLKRDLALLGFEDVAGKKLKRILQELTESQPLVIVNVKENGQYVNAYLQGMSEGGPANTDDDDDDDDDEPEEDDDDAAEAEATIEVGSEVTFTNDDDEEVLGTVKKIKGDQAVVEDGDGAKHKVAVEDLTLAGPEESGEEEEEEEEEEEPEIEVGSQVKWTDPDDDDNELEGEVKKITKDKAIVEDEDGDKHKVDLSDLSLA